MRNGAETHSRLKVLATGRGVREELAAEELGLSELARGLLARVPLVKVPELLCNSPKWSRLLESRIVAHELAGVIDVLSDGLLLDDVLACCPGLTDECRLSKNGHDNVDGRDVVAIEQRSEVLALARVLRVDVDRLDALGVLEQLLGRLERARVNSLERKLVGR